MLSFRTSSAFWVPVILVAVGCAGSRTVTFSSMEQGSQLSRVPISNPDSEGQRLRNPASMPLATLKDQAVRISASGKASQYWYLPQTEGNQLRIKVNRLPSCGDQEQNRNRPVRLLLKGYQALYRKDYNLARELSAQASIVDPTLAAPHIITGIAYLKEGKRSQARSSFQKASALDPADAEISALLRATQ